MKFMTEIEKNGYEEKLFFREICHTIYETQKNSFNAVYKNGKKSYGRAKNGFLKCHTIYETKNSVSK